jgi:phosphoglycolate phosphatase
VVDGAMETLNALQNLKKRLFISSLTPEDTLNKIVIKRGMNFYFEHIFGSPKTKVSHLKKIQYLTGVMPSDIVYIGDSNSDMTASLQFGCNYIGIGKDESIYDSKPAYFLKDFTNFFKGFKNEN